MPLRLSQPQVYRINHRYSGKLAYKFADILSEISFHRVPFIEFSIELQVFVVGVEYSGLLSHILPLLFKLFLEFPPLILSYIDRIASMTATVLASVLWQAGSSLETRYLAKAAFSMFRKGLHAFLAATVFHDKGWIGWLLIR